MKIAKDQIAPSSALPPIEPLPIRAVLINATNEYRREYPINTGDRNMLVHAAQELGAKQVLDINYEMLRRFRENSEDVLRGGETDKPGVTIFMTWAYPMGSRAEIENLPAFVGGAKKVFFPALWINLNNDVVSPDLIKKCSYEIDRDVNGIDLDVMLTSVGMLYGISSPPDKKAPDFSGNILKLDALPSARPQISRTEAKAWFLENYGLTLKEPITIVALGNELSERQQRILTESCERIEGSVLITTGPRTKASSFIHKNPRYRDPRASDIGPYWRDLYDRADLIHVFGKKDAPNPYPYLLAVADRGIVTADSMSLPSDFVAARVPFLVVDSSGCNKFFISHLVEKGYARWIKENEDGGLKMNSLRWPDLPRARPLPVDVLRSRVAGLIAQKLRTATP